LGEIVLVAGDQAGCEVATSARVDRDTKLHAERLTPIDAFVYFRIVDGIEAL
jgi:hypothetical protein